VDELPEAPVVHADEETGVKVAITKACGENAPDVGCTHQR